VRPVRLAVSLASCLLALLPGAPAGFPRRDGLLAFVRTPGPEIWLVGPDGTALRRLTVGAQPAWAPDGRTLAFVDGGAVWTIGLDGARRRLGRGSEPDWSPDATQLVLVRGASLWTIGAGGRGLRRLTRPRQHERDTAPAWSPDGGTIAFYRSAPSARREGLWFVRVARRRPAREGAAPPAPALAWTPTGRLSGDRGWSASGRYLALALEPPDQPGGSEVYVARADRSHARRVTFSPPGTAAADPVWQPRCTIRGTAHAERLVGTSGPDEICGFGGDDRILARGGNDVVLGGDGNDVIVGGDGRDRLFGGRGADTIEARGHGRDALDGGPGRDRPRGDRRDLFIP
jgi:Tol biopolymer transport system component